MRELGRREASRGRWGVVKAAVATLWTHPMSCEAVDRLVLGEHPQLNQWLERLGEGGRLRLWETNRIQSQLLMGTPVEVIDQTDSWFQVVVPSQSSEKEKRGYPGWLPAQQIAMVTPAEWAVARQLYGGDIPAMLNEAKAAVQFVPYVVVTEPLTTLVLANEAREEAGDEAGEEGEGAKVPSMNKQEVILSYQTRLPLAESRIKTSQEANTSGSSAWLQVETPLGSGVVARDHVRVVTTTQPLLPPREGAELIAQGQRFLGLPYLWGGMSAYGYDCSGFAYSIHQAFGITIPRDASDQSEAGQPITQDQLQPGDLLFFAYEQGRGRVHHVGFYGGNGRMLHSPYTGKSIEIIAIAGTIYEEEFCGARRYWTETN